MRKVLSERFFSAIILAAGRSERMGLPKFLLKFSQEITFLEKIVNTYVEFGSRNVIVVMNDEGVKELGNSDINLPSEVIIAVNHHPEREKFLSLLTGVKSLVEYDHVFISNIDNPFVNPEVLHVLDQQADNYDYVFPAFRNKGGHPFMISEKVVQDIKNKPHEQIHLKEFLKRYPFKAVEVDDEMVLVNINTMEDYSRYFCY